jgi:acetyl-CoA carboxylase biotin carboxyl carrier protein
MTIQEIKELIQVFNESNVAEMEVQRGDNRLRLRRAPTPQEMTAQEMVAPAAAHAHSPSPGHSQSSAAPAKTAASETNHTLVKSPIVGTYYDAPSPGAPTFVNVGDAVEPGQVLCIIESMKLMNEIEAEIAGTIVHKLVENGRPVEYGEALFAVRPR